MVPEMGFVQNAPAENFRELSGCRPTGWGAVGASHISHNGRVGVELRRGDRWVVVLHDPSNFSIEGWDSSGFM